MSALDLLDVLAVGAVVGAALVAVLVPRRAAATTAFLVFGILLAVLWGRFDAPDVAIAEAALGGGIAGALLVDALGRRTPPHPDAGDGTAPRTTPARGGADSAERGRSADSAGGVRPTARRTLPIAVAVLGGGAAAVALLTVMRQVGTAPAAVAGEALARIDQTGVGNPVTAVLLNYRSLDTLLEIAVLATAAYAAGSVARADVRPVTRAEPVRRALALVLVPVLMVLAVWVLVAGSSQPGGAFQSGALLAAAMVIGHLCGLPLTTPRGRGAVAVSGGGVVAFVLLGVVGLAVTGAWLGLDPSWAGAAILAIEAVLAVSIAVALVGVFLAAGANDVVREREGASA